MGLFKDWPGSPYMVQMQMFIVQSVGLLAWLSHIALAQFDVSEAVTGSASFPSVAITCIGNLAVFLTCLLRGRLDVEMGARDFLATITGPGLEGINGFGLTTCREDLSAAEVVMLSKCTTPNYSIRQFMKYFCNVYGVNSIFLPCFPLASFQEAAEICCRRPPEHVCKCIVFNTVEDITVMLAERMPGTLKKLSDSKCLLPCFDCLTNGCHGCNQRMLHVNQKVDIFETINLTEDGPRIWPAAAVCEMIDDVMGITQLDEGTCICIPTRPAQNDKWTEMLISSFNTQDKEATGTINVASDALRNYISQIGVCDDEEEYDTASFIVPRLTEILINVILTGWLRVDGFSSSLVARRAVKGYIVDSRGIGVAANAFITKSQVHSNYENTDVCQMLTFRGGLVSFGPLCFAITFVNLFCSICWAVLIALEGGVGKWYDPDSMPPSKIRVAVIMAAIGIALVLDCWQICINMLAKIPTMVRVGGAVLILALEIGCIVLWATRGLHAFGRWIYGVLHVLVWIKWGISSCLLNEDSLSYEKYYARVPQEYWSCFNVRFYIRVKCHFPWSSRKVDVRTILRLFFVKTLYL